MGLKNCETTITIYLPENEQGARTLEEIKEELKAIKQRDTDNMFGRLEISVAKVSEDDWANSGRNILSR